MGLAYTNINGIKDKEKYILYRILLFSNNVKVMAITKWFLFSLQIVVMIIQK